MNPVEPTGLYTAELRKYGGIQYALEIFDLACDISRRTSGKDLRKGWKGKGKEIYAPQIEARYRVIGSLLRDPQLLGRGSVRQVLDIGAGLTPRGIAMSGKGMKYVQVDLPFTTAVMESVVEMIVPGERRPDGLHMLSANALSYRQLQDATVYFDRSQPLVVVTEGLLRYFGEADKKRIAENVRNVMRNFRGGVWITPDRTLESVLTMEEKVGGQTTMLDDVTGIRLEGHTFKSPDQFREFFKSVGFVVEEEHPFEEAGKLASPDNLREIRIDLKEDTLKSLLDGCIVAVIRPV